MPTPLILKYAQKSKKQVHEVEAAWEQSKKEAEGIRRSKQRDPQYWALVNGLTKKKLGITESTSFKEFNEISKIDE
jgi:hypothetical protein